MVGGLQVKLRRHIASDNTRERIHRTMCSAWACGLGVESGAGSASCASPCAWHFFFCLWVTVSNALCSGSLCCRANLSVLPIISPVHARMQRKLHQTALVAPSACAFRVALGFFFFFFFVPRPAAFLELRTSFFGRGVQHASHRCFICCWETLQFFVFETFDSCAIFVVWAFSFGRETSAAQLQCLREK